MDLIVRYKNEFLGSGVFWVGPDSQIDEIRNMVARDLAEQVAVDGQARSDGMWSVEQYNEVR